MNRNRSFEEDVRHLLDDMASEPAPEHLIEGVRSIPAEHPRRGSFLVRFGRPLAMTTAVAAVAVIAIVAGIALRPGADGGPGVAASAGTSLATSSPAPTAALSPTPPQSPAAGSAASGAIGAAVPGGFSPVSVTFVSPERGFVLGSVPSGNDALAKIAQTNDAGRTWTYGSMIPTTIAATAAGPGEAGVSTLRFATANDGWAFGPQELWATHDGGSTWTKITLPGLNAEPTIEALETATGLVHAVVLDCAADGCSFVIETAAVHGSDWQLAALRLPVGAGPVPAAQLVLSGSAGWVLQNDRVVTNGARLVAGTWVAWQPPCADVQGPAVLAASSETELAATCNVGEWADPRGEHLFVSHDGGSTFASVGGRMTVDGIGAVATSSRTTVAVAGLTSARSVIEATFDGGATWEPVFQATPGCTFRDLGFTTESQGVAIASAGGQALLVMSRDGGHSWTWVNF